MLTPTQTLQKMLERVFSDPMKSGEKGKEQDNPNPNWPQQAKQMSDSRRTTNLTSSPGA